MQRVMCYQKQFRRCSGSSASMPPNKQSDLVVFLWPNSVNLAGELEQPFDRDIVLLGVIVDPVSFAQVFHSFFTE